MSAMTIAVAVAIDTVARFELPLLLAGIIGYLPRGSLRIVCSSFVSPSGKRFRQRFPERKNSTPAEQAFAFSRSSGVLVLVRLPAAHHPRGFIRGQPS
jgi:hypothetical protein